ncbi:MAG TPA: hypothetical protein VFZ12_05600 [Dehalococcoidia bacterium]|nr:hypothetical protein [Dehalococcoidia bacterium]
MTQQRSQGPAGSQVWEAGYQALFEGWRQAQDFWNNAARSWGETAGSWFGQFPSSTRSGLAGEGMEVYRELNEASLSVAMAWMRLPLAMVGATDRRELQEAVSRLAETQGRAYQLWLEAISSAGANVAGAARSGAASAERAAGEVQRSASGRASAARQARSGSKAKAKPAAKKASSSTRKRTSTKTRSTAKRSSSKS